MVQALGKRLLDSFLEVVGNTALIGKADAGKYAILSHFSTVKTLNSNSRSKHTPHAINSAPSEANSRPCFSLN